MRTNPLLQLIAIIIAALWLRMVFTAISPLQPLIQGELHASFGQLGMFATLPQLSSGLLCFVIPWLLHRLIPEALTALGLLLMSALILVAFISNIYLIYALLILSGAGIAFAQTGLQTVIKQHYDKHRVQVMALMIASLHGGSALVALSTLPLAELSGSWRVSILVFSVLVLLSVLLWWWAYGTRWRYTAGTTETEPTRLSISIPILIAIMGFFTSSGIVYVSLLTWMPNYYLGLGWSEQTAANMFAVFLVSQCAAAIWLAWQGRNHWDKRFWLALSTLVCLLGLVFALWGNPWAVLLIPVLTGFGLGVSFGLAMTLPLDYSRTPKETGFIVTLAVGVGSTLCAPFPYLIGWLKDVTQSNHIGLWIMAIAGGLMLISCIAFKKPAEEHSLQTNT